MPRSTKRLRGLRQSIRSRLNGLLQQVAGRDFLTDDEADSLPEPKGPSFVEQAFFMGRVQSVVKSKEYKEMSLDKIQKLSKRSSLSAAEKKALEYVQNHTGVYIKDLVSKMETGVFAAISAVDEAAVADAAARDVIRHEIADAIAESTDYRDVAAILAKKLPEAYSKDWKKIAVTELHFARQRGKAAAIKEGYNIHAQGSGGRSKVSVLTEPGRCSDCANLYENADGSPKVFVLDDLLANGTNVGRNNSRLGGIRPHWLPVVPPGHPSCACNLVLVPSGFQWNGRKLVSDGTLKKSSVNGVEIWYLSTDGRPIPPTNSVGTTESGKSYKIPKGQNALMPDGTEITEAQARQTGEGGDRTQVREARKRDIAFLGEADTVAVQLDGSETAVAHQQISDDSTPVGSATPTEQGTPVADGTPVDADATGVGTAVGSSVAKDSSNRPAPRATSPSKSYGLPDFSAKPAVAVDGLPREYKDIKYAADRASAEGDKWSRKATVDEKLTVLHSGEFDTDLSVRLGDKQPPGQHNPNENLPEGGVTESYMVKLIENGSAILKPDTGLMIRGKDLTDTGKMMMSGARTVPFNTSAIREVSAYTAVTAAGFPGRVPPTALRNAIVGKDEFLCSVQHKEPGTTDAARAARNAGNTDEIDVMKDILIAQGMSEDEAAGEIATTIALQVFMCTGDGHGGNVLVRTDTTQGPRGLMLVDNATSFATGMADFKSTLFAKMDENGEKLVIPEDTLNTFRNMSYKDFAATMANDSMLEDWAVAQSFLRAKYIVHLHDRDGELSYEYFRTTHLGNPVLVHWAPYGSNADIAAEFDKRKQEGTLPADMFDSFAKKWIMDTADGDGPDAEAAKSMLDNPPLVAQGTAGSPSVKRNASATNREAYFFTVDAKYPPPISSFTPSNPRVKRKPFKPSP